MTYADLKRDAATGRLKLELISRFSKTDDEIPMRYRGARSVIPRSYGLELCNISDDGTSRLYIPSAKLLDYDGKNLTIYAVGNRDLTSEEISILNKWQQIQEECLNENPWADLYWKKKRFFQDSKCPWMSGFDRIRGKKYLAHNNQVSDFAVRGPIILKYNVIME